MIGNISGSLLSPPPSTAHDDDRQPIRVLMYLFFPGGGIGRYTHELLTHMRRLPADVEVELVCQPDYQWRDRAPYAMWPGLKQISHHNSVRRRMRFLEAQWVNPRRLAARARARGAQIVHLSNINHLTFPMWRQHLKSTGAKVAATVHDVDRAKAMLNRRYERGQLAAFYRGADALFVHSRAQLDQLCEFAGVKSNKVHIVPMGPYDYGTPTALPVALRVKYGLPRNKHVALFFGTVRDDKRLDLMIEALAPFRDSVHLLVAGRFGSGHCGLEPYRRQARRAGLEQSITFIEKYIPDEEVADLFALCDWVALPYSRQFSSQSAVLSVAVAHHRPAIISECPTFSETLDAYDLGVRVQPDSLPSLVRGITDMEHRVGTRHRHQFDAYINDHSWQRNVDQTIAVYRSLLPFACSATHTQE